MFSGALFSNQPRCQLPAGVLPLPRCHGTSPYLLWRSDDGIELPYIKELPGKHPPRAVVLHVPGTDTVTGDFASVTSELVNSGFAVYGCENRTFRYGPGEDSSKGDAVAWEPWTRDLRGFSRFVRGLHPGVPIFWHGHSFGGVQVLQTAAMSAPDEAPDGLIVHSPAFGMMFKKATFWRGLRFGIIAWLRVPWTRLMETSNLPMSDDPVWDCRWKHSEDRLRQGIKVRFFIHAANMAIQARNSSPHLTLPVLAMWGGRDRMGLGGKETLRAEYDHYMRHELAGGTAALFYCERGHHLLTEGSTKADAIATIVSWLNSQTSSARIGQEMPPPCAPGSKDSPRGTIAPSNPTTQPATP